MRDDRVVNRPRGVVTPEFLRLMLANMLVGAAFVAIGLFQLPGGVPRDVIVGAGLFILAYGGVVCVTIAVLLTRRRRRERAEE